MKFADPNQMPVFSVTMSDGKLKVKTLDIPMSQCANSTCFSPDGKTMYYTDTPTRIIYQYDYSEDGKVSNPRPFFSLVGQ
jgi:L-arabinonolactonase